MGKQQGNQTPFAGHELDLKNKAKLMPSLENCHFQAATVEYVPYSAAAPKATN